MGAGLKDLQTLIYRAITAAPGPTRIAQTEVLSSVIRGDERLSALQRLEIYAEGYSSRLLDCLKEDFPATASVSGDAFEGLVRTFLVAHPPGEPSIFYAGRLFPDFLADHPVQKSWPFLSELARLERTLIEVFHAADAPALTATKVGATAPADWPGLRFRPHPTLRVLNCKWRVNDVRGAIDGGTEWGAPARTSVSLLAWRRGSQVYYRELAEPERAAFEAVSRGAEFATVCEAFAARFDGDSLADAIKQMLTGWVAEGLLADHDKLAGEAS